MRRIMCTGALLAACAVGAQTPLQIAWQSVAQARSNAAGATPIVQSLAEAVAPAPVAVKVDRVVAAPTTIRSPIGKPVCLSQFDIAAYTDTGERARDVPLKVDMRQDQLRKLTFSPKAKDLCFQPLKPGEYAIRFTSTLPAADGTLRGAQVFVRAG